MERVSRMNIEILQLAGLGALIAIIAQTGAMFYWGGKLQASVTRHDEDIYDHEIRIRHIMERLRD